MSHLVINKLVPGAHRTPLQQMMIHPRLKRLERLFFSSPVYFITFCAKDRKLILDSQKFHQSFVEFSVNASTKHFFVGRYLIMPDHVHFFLSVSTESIFLSVWIKSLKNFLSKSLKVQGIPPPHWQKGFFDHVMRTEESYSEKWNYVILNPVRAGLSESPSDWPYQGEINPIRFSE